MLLSDDLELILNNYIEPLSRAFGIYIPLITVNCIILSRALSYTSSRKITSNIADTFKMGIGYTIALALIGLIRELLGNNTITIMDKLSDLTGYIMKYEIFPTNDFIPNLIFLTPAGAFLTLGLILGVINAIRRRKSE